MSGTYVTDVSHYLDDDGEIVANVPIPARKLASFLVLIIDCITAADVPATITSTLRCRKRGCHGSVIIALPNPMDEIHWQCNKCQHNGIISQWQGTKWDNRDRALKA